MEGRETLRYDSPSNVTRVIAGQAGPADVGNGICQASLEDHESSIIMRPPKSRVVAKEDLMARQPHVRFDSGGNEVDEQGKRIKRRPTLGDRSPELPSFHARFGVAPSTLVEADSKYRPKARTPEDEKRLAKYRRHIQKNFKGD
jgi:hypothetical protein